MHNLFSLFFFLFSFFQSFLAQTRLLIFSSFSIKSNSKSIRITSYQEEMKTAVFDLQKHIRQRYFRECNKKECRENPSTLKDTKYSLL